MRTFNINPFPVDAKQQMHEANASVNKNSNPDSFKSILASVKVEKPRNVSKLANLPSQQKIAVVDKNSLNNGAVEDAVAQSMPDKSTDGRKDEKISSADSRRRAVKNSPEKENAISEEKSITVELDVEDMVQSSDALAQSLAAASNVLPQEEASSDSELAEAFTMDISSAEDALPETVLSVAISEGLDISSEEEVAIEMDAGEGFEELMAASVGANEPKVSGDAMAIQDAADENALAMNVESQVSGSSPADEKAEASVKSFDKNAGPEERKSVFNVIDQRTTDGGVEKIASEDGNKSSGNMLDANLNSNQMFASVETPVQNQVAQATDAGFQQVLSQQIQNSAPEFVKAGSILLKDNNSGSINMILKPENLGNVKVSLELSDKILSGQIVVQSKEAFEAFKQNMDTLRQAFQSNGFENANLNLVLADNANSNGTFGQGQQPSGEQFMANRTYNDFAQSGEAAETSSVSDAYNKIGDHQIDVVA